MPFDIFMTGDQTQGFIRIGQTVFAATGPAPITDAAIHDLIQGLAADVAEKGPALGILQYSPFQSPTAAQRKALTDAEEQLKQRAMKRVAIVSESALVRGAIRALAWLMRSEAQVKAYSVRDWQDSVRWLADGDPKTDVAKGIAVIRELAVKVGLETPP